jgi:hypothetical protein
MFHICSHGTDCILNQILSSEYRHHVHIYRISILCAKQLQCIEKELCGFCNIIFLYARDSAYRKSELNSTLELKYESIVMLMSCSMNKENVNT